MPSIPDRGVEVKISDTNGAPNRVLGNLHVSCIGTCQYCFVLFGSEKIDGMNGAIFLHKSSEMTIKRGLGCLRPRDLDALAKCLEALLFPEH